MRRFALGLLLTLCVWNAAGGEIFSWEEGGVVHFTDDPQTAPIKKGAKVTVRSGGTESRAWQFFNSENNVNYYYDPSSLTYQGRDRYTVLIKEEYRREFYEKPVELDCTRRMFRYGGSSVKNNNLQDSEVKYRYEDYSPLTNTMRALSGLVCNK